MFITGGASGLGLAAVWRLHGMGASVAVVDQNTEELQKLQSELQVRALCLTCDVTVEEEVKRAIDATIEKFGTIHVAVTSAGVSWQSQTLTSKTSLDTDMFRKLMQINVYGTVFVAKYAAVAMAKNKPQDGKNGERGAIIFVSSIAAEEAQRGQVAYGASKGALNGMLMPMARDLGKYGIRVAAVAPGPFATNLAVRDGKLPPAMQKFFERTNKEVAVGRGGDPPEFAHLVTTIIENSYINGVPLRLDGAYRIPHM